MKKAVESVTEGHPDKVCDQIADAIVDEFLRRDTQARVNINVMGSRGMLMIGGEVNSKADFDLAALAKKVYTEIGYTDDIEVFSNIEESPVHNGKGRNVTSAAVVNGYATRETRELMPRPIVFARNVARRIDDLRRTDPSFSWLLPHGKVQLIMSGKEVETITVKVSHIEDISLQDVRTAILERVIDPIIGESGTKIFINAGGIFTAAGLQSDSGASGRKMAVDTYGGLVPHGDSALSGKDPLHADRAGTYMARHVARYLVSEGLVQAAMVSAAYTPGQAEPIHLEVRGVGEKTRGSKMDLTNLVKERFDFRPEAIAEKLGLLKPVYRQAAMYGQIGRPGLPWEEDKNLV